MLREIIKPYLVEWPMSDDLPIARKEINRLVAQLDDLALGYEAKWGIGQLESWARDELADKFQRQVDKLTEAIQTEDVRAVRDLADGFVRAYAALEANAVKLGHKPNDPVIFFYQCGSTLYRVVRTNAETKQVKGDYVLSCEELVRLYHRKAEEVFNKREPNTATIMATDAQGFNWATGDDLPEF